MTAFTTPTLLPARGIVAVTGADRAAFLQGLITQDVTLAAPGSLLYGCLLTAQGRFLHDLFITETGDALWLDCEAARAADLVQRLGRYKLRSAVEITDMTATHSVAVAPHHTDGMPDPRLPELGSRLMLPRAALPAADDAALAAYDHLRLTLGVPDGSRDMIVGESLPLECNLDRLQAISFKKGCYMGQEMTARTHYRALLKKRLLPCRIEGPCPPPGTVVTTADGREAGVMRSGQDGIGLALLRLDAVETGAPLICGAATLTPATPAWLQPQS